MKLKLEDYITQPAVNVSDMEYDEKVKYVTDVAAHVWFEENPPVPPVPPTPGPETVDLGLPSGTLWAKTNIGAQSETDYGDYYQWAATTPLHVEGTTVNPAADWNLCPYTDSGGNPSKYTGSDYDTLQTSDDVVASQFTGYRMPTQDDFQELIDETDNEWVEDFNGSGVNGYKFTNKLDSSKYIFLPASGSCLGSDLVDVGGGGDYWSSSLSTDYSDAAWYLYFYNGEVIMYDNNRFYGFSIRPVKNNTNTTDLDQGIGVS